VGTPARHDRSETLGVTAPHPFWVCNREQPAFIEAEKLEAGDELLTADGRNAVVTSKVLEHAPSGKTFTTYNFEVEDYHTYFAGESAVWVHNHGQGDCKRAVSIWMRLMSRNGGQHWDAMNSLFARLRKSTDKILETLSLRQAVFKDVLKAKYPNGAAVLPNLIGDSPPGIKLKNIYALKKSSGSHQVDFVVTKAGELRAGRGHPSLAAGDEIISAGQATIVNGRLAILNNWSGHYLPMNIKCLSLYLLKRRFPADGDGERVPPRHRGGDER